MGDMMRLSSSGGALGGGFHRDKLGSPSTGSEDGGGIDLADIAQELDQDEFDGPATLNGMDSLIIGLSPVVFLLLLRSLSFFTISLAPGAFDRPAITAPPESEWYHGRLDRYSAEQRLKSTTKLGSYLGKRGAVVACKLSTLINGWLFFSPLLFTPPQTNAHSQCAKVTASPARTC